MKNIIYRTTVVSFLIISLFACATTREEAGALSGAAVGAVVGSTVGKGSGRALAIWLGAVVGAQIGSTIGRYMDDQDRMRTAQILETNRTTVASSWHNPDTGYDYTVTPTKTYETGQGPCREFTVDAMIGGKVQQVYGTACRQADGSWKVIK